MKKTLLALVSAVLISQGAYASILTNAQLATCANPDSCNVNGIDLVGSAITNVQGHAQSNLAFAGAGIRLHTFVVKVQVYLVQLLMNDPSKFVRNDDGGLKSLDSETSVALLMNFKWGVSASDVQKAFRDGLNANTDKYDMNSAEVNQFLAAVQQSGDAQNGHTMSIVGEKLADGEYITYESTQGVATTIKGGAGFVKAIFAIWLGNTADDADLTNTKHDLYIDRLNAN